MKAVGRVDASLEADDSGRMFRLIGLDRPAAAAKGPGSFSIDAQGPSMAPSISTAASPPPTASTRVCTARCGSRARPAAIRSCGNPCRSRLVARARRGQSPDRGAHIPCHGQWPAAQVRERDGERRRRPMREIRSRTHPPRASRANSMPTRLTPAPSLRASPGCRPAAATTLAGRAVGDGLLGGVSGRSP